MVAGAELGGLHSFMYNFKQVGNPLYRLGYFWLIQQLHQTYFCDRVNEAILRPLFCAPSPAAPGVTSPSAPPPCYALHQYYDVSRSGHRSVRGVYHIITSSATIPSYLLITSLTVYLCTLKQRLFCFFILTSMN